MDLFGLLILLSVVFSKASYPKNIHNLCVECNINIMRVTSNESHTCEAG